MRSAFRARQLMAMRDALAQAACAVPQPAPVILGIIDRHGNEVHATVTERPLESRNELADRLDSGSTGTVRSHTSQNRVANVIPKSGIDLRIASNGSCRSAILNHQHHRLNFKRTAVSISWLFIMKPRPAYAITRRFG